MVHTFSSYRIELQTQQPADLHAGSSAVLSLLDAQGQLIDQKHLHYLTAEAVYEQIDRGGCLHLGRTLVENWSMTEYRRSRQLPEHQLVPIAGILAEGAVLASQAIVDLSGLQVGAEGANFDHALFLAPRLSFARTEFACPTTSFQTTYFGNEWVDFANAQFQSVQLSFKNAEFAVGTKDFQHVRFAAGKVNFANAHFNEGDVNFASVEFLGGLVNFRLTRFGAGSVRFEHLRAQQVELNFEGAEFGDGELNFMFARLIDSKLNLTRTKFGQGDKLFVNTDFGAGNLSCVNTHFGQGVVSFKLANFAGGKLDFHFCTLQGDLIFERTQLGTGGADFRAAEFSSGKISFTRTEIERGDLNFDGASFHDMRLMFKYTIFGASGQLDFGNCKAASSYLLFENIKLNSTELIFHRAVIGTLIMRACHLDSYIDLRVSSCAELDLSDTVVRDIIDFHTLAHVVDIQRFTFTNLRLIGKLYLDWKHNRLKALIYQQETTYAQRADQFRTLKENFNSIGHYASEDAAYVEFKRQEAKALRLEQSTNWPRRLWANIEYYFKWFVFDLVGLYATNPVRVLFSMLMWFMGFTLLYITLGESSTWGILSSLGDPEKLTLVEKAFYHSGVTFLTIGYGDYYPMGIVRWISEVEGFMGLFLMSYFTVAFVRKILR